jgi:hypothetical protein
MYLTRYVFDGIDITALLTSTHLRRPRLDVGVELARIVEGGHHNIPALPSIRVIAIVQNNPATDAVIVRIYPGHGRSIRSRAIESSFTDAGQNRSNAAGGKIRADQRAQGLDENRLAIGE